MQSTPWLPPGSSIAVFCPCGPPHRQRTRIGLAWLEEQGYRPLLSPLLSRWLGGTACPPLPYLAGTDPERLAELHWALHEADAAAAWAVRGGYGLTRLLDDFTPPAIPRLVLGFSDLTALFCLLGKAGWPRLLHAPNVQSLALALEGAEPPGAPPGSADGPAGAHRESLDTLLAVLLRGEMPSYRGEAWVGGCAEGRLLGGNLCVLASLCGTAHQPSLDDGVLFLEDVNEAPYRLDRYLTQLERSGVTRGLRAVALGEFKDCGDPEEARKALSERLGSWGLPVLAGLPVGHGDCNHPLPLGLRVAVGGDSDNLRVLDLRLHQAR